MTHKNGAPPLVDVSVVTGRRPELVYECLDTLLANRNEGLAQLRLFVTVNDGNPDTASRIAHRYPQVQVILNDDPRGFAANHNRVLGESDAEYAAILNDDLVFHSTCIETCLSFMMLSENQAVAMVSPKLLNPDGSLQPSTYSFPTILQSAVAKSDVRRTIPDWIMRPASKLLRRRKGSSRFWKHDETIDVDTFRGACVVARMSAVRAVGLMDEVALVGGEETEWHRRMKDEGWRIVFHPSASVEHVGQQSVGGNPRLRIEYLKGALNYHAKHSSALANLTLRTAFITIFSAQWLGAVLLMRPDDRLRARLGLWTSITWQPDKAGA